MARAASIGGYLRHPEILAVGDALDFWRVEAWEPDRRLRLAAPKRRPSSPGKETAA
jgi:hypothetical protein